ncbi:MAG: hypothetical protein AAGF12_19895 [Myxococcota bacterium]
MDGDEGPATPQETIGKLFHARYVAGAPFVQDRTLADELTLEAQPIIDALLFAQAEGAAGLDHHREALAMITLLGRRAAMLGATPTAGLALVPALGAGFESAGRPLPPKMIDSLTSMCVEGYVAGRDDLTEAAMQRSAVDACSGVEIAPRLLALVLAGEPAPEVVAEVGERFGRQLHKRDAAGCIVDLSGLRPTPPVAVEAFAIDESARMLGAHCIFVGVGEAWEAAAAEARVGRDLIRTEPTFADALRTLLPLVGLELRATSWLPEPIRQLFRGSS